MQKRQSYSKDAAIKVITPKIPVTLETASVYKALSMLSKKSKDFDTIDYIYITDKHNKLVGIVPIKKLFENATEKAERQLKDIMTTDLITVCPHTSQEKTAHMALKNGLKAIPITGKDRTLLGAVSHDQILSIMHREKEEDLLRLVGIYDYRAEDMDVGKMDNVMRLSLWKSVRRRLPWLIIGTLGGLLMAQTISYFQTTMEKNILIAAFIPLMVYLSNAVGQQITIFLIRDASHDHRINYFKYFLRHFVIVLVLALILGGLLALFSLVNHQDIKITAILGVGAFSTTLSAILTGFLIPFIFIKLKKDPANASGPVATVLQDLLSVLIYFLVASSIL